MKKLLYLLPIAFTFILGACDISDITLDITSTSDVDSSSTTIITTTTSDDDPSTTTSEPDPEPDPDPDPDLFPSLEIIEEDPHEDHVDTDTWSVITSETTTLTDGNKYYLTENVTLISNLTVEGTVTLCLNGKVLSGNGQGSVITVTEGSEFTLSDCQDGAEGVENTLSLYSDESYTYTYNCGVLTGGDFTLEGDTYGGGAIRAEYATVRMNGGAIGFNLARVAELTSGGAYGGAIYLNYSNFIMNGGELSYNESYSHGGAIYATQSHILINDAKILYNIALHAGSGIYLRCANIEDVTSSLTITNSIFSDNYACTYGAIAISSSYRSYYTYDTGHEVFATRLTIDNSEFSDNYAINGGAAIDTSYVYGVITNTTFTDNEVSILGGAMYLESSVFDLYDVTISGNIAPSGGGIYAHNGILNMYSGTVTNNTATSTYESQSPTAGGIHVNYRCIFNMYGGTVSDNYCTAWDDDYDLYVGPQATINIYGGVVSNNIYAKGSNASPTINIYGGYVGGIGLFDGTVLLTIYAGYFSFNVAGEEWSSYIADGSYATYLTRTTNDPNYNSSYPYAVYQSE